MEPRRETTLSKVFSFRRAWHRLKQLYHTAWWISQMCIQRQHESPDIPTICITIAVRRYEFPSPWNILACLAKQPYMREERPLRGEHYFWTYEVSSPDLAFADPDGQDETSPVAFQPAGCLRLSTAHVWSALLTEDAELSWRNASGLFLDGRFLHTIGNQHGSWRSAFDHT